MSEHAAYAAQGVLHCAQPGRSGSISICGPRASKGLPVVAPDERRSRKCSMLKLDGQKLDDGRWFTDSVERNKDPILNLLKRVLPHAGLILEIGSGTGRHVAHFAKAF